MAFTLQNLINSPYSVRLISIIGQVLPLRLGHTLADFIADLITSRRDSPLVRAVRLNQWIARGEMLDKVALDQAVRETFRNTARSLYNLYHYVNNTHLAERLVVFDPTFEQIATRLEFNERGLMAVGLHLSNFDLVMQWLCRQKFKPLALTIPNPQGGGRLEFEMRKKTGMNLLPASVSAYRQAARHLQKGGLVVTGIDRPVPDPPYHPLFFGRPSALPMHHIVLALKARVPVVIVVTSLLPDGKYHLMTSELIEMESHPNRDTETQQNAEKVLYIAERFIRLAPQQWSVSLPVWPQVLDLVP
jgi:lauroyl/myristoyl acyltransferase